MERLKAAILPALGGIVVGMALMTFVFGFVRGSVAQEQAEQAAEAAAEAVWVQVYAPLCVEAAQADPERVAEVLATSSSFTQRRAVSDAGWASYPEGAGTNLQRAIQDGCIVGLSG